MSTTLKWITLLCCCFLFTACTADEVIRDQFEKSVKDFNRMLRWQEMSGAGALYVAPELLDQYSASAALLKVREVTITDYRILAMNAFPEKKRGDALVEFDYYALPSTRIRTQAYKQDWIYQDSDLSKGWQLKSGLPPFE